MPARIILNDVVITVHENRSGNAHALGYLGNELLGVDVLEQVLQYVIQSFCVLTVDAYADFVKLREKGFAL